MMIELPEATKIHKKIDKKLFYERLPMTSALKEKFVSDVERIFVENSLTAENLRLTKASAIAEILLVVIELKKQQFDGKILEAIARQNPHKLLFLLSYEAEVQLALYHGKLYRSPWRPTESFTLSAKGFSLKEIWDGFIERIALSEERVKAVDAMTIDQRLALQDKILRLEKMIAKTEAAAWRETQPKKRFALYTKLQAYKQELEAVKNGASQNAHAESDG